MIGARQVNSERKNRDRFKKKRQIDNIGAGLT